MGPVPQPALPAWLLSPRQPSHEERSVGLVCVDKIDGVVVFCLRKISDSG